MDTFDIPLPKSSKKNDRYSPSQYSPSRATTPLSDEEPPLPPPSASPPPIPKAPQGKKVLMGHQAKKRLQAFITQSNTKLNKKRTADIFQADEDDFPEAASKKGKKFDKDSLGKSEIQKIMEEEIRVKEMHQEARMNLIKENIEKQIKQQQEKESVEMDGESKAEEGRNSEKIGTEGEGRKDLREQLREKRRQEDDKKKIEEEKKQDKKEEKRRESNRGKEDLREILERMKNKGKGSSKKGERSTSKNSDASSGDDEKVDVSSKSRKETSSHDRSRSARGSSPQTKSKSDRESSPPEASKSDNSRSRSTSVDDRRDRADGKHDSSPSPKQDASPSPPVRKLNKSRAPDASPSPAPKSGRSGKKSKRGRQSSSPESLRGSTKRHKKRDDVASDTDSRDSSTETERRTKTKSSRDKPGRKGDKEDSPDSVKDSGKKKRSGARIDAQNGDKDKHRRSLDQHGGKERSESRAESRMSSKSSDVHSSAEKKKKKKKENIDAVESISEKVKKKKKAPKEKDDEDSGKKRKKNAHEESLDTTIDIASSIDEDYYAVLPVIDEDYKIVHGVQLPQERLARGQVLRFRRNSQLETLYCKTKITWSHNPQIDRENKSEELKASVDSVLMELEREVGQASQSASEGENSKFKKKKNKKKKKKGKTPKGKDVEKMKKILDKISKAKKKLKKNKEKIKEKKQKASKTEIEINAGVTTEAASFEAESSMTVEEEVTMQANSPSPAPVADLPDSPVPALEPEQPEEGVECIAPPLSSSGMTKLFALAGYQPDKKNDKEISDDKKDATFESPEKSNLTFEDKVSPPNPLRFSIIQKSPGIELKNKLSSPDESPQFVPKKDEGSTPNDMNSPLHKEEKEENAVSQDSPPKSAQEPTTRSPTPPRLPKMRDSRSPAKVPIMRDRRSPIEKRLEDDIGNDRSKERIVDDEYNSRSQIEKHPDYDYGRSSREADHDSRRKYVSPRRGDRSYHVSPKGRESGEYTKRQRSPQGRYSPRRDKGSSPRKYSPRRDHVSPRGHYSPRRDFDGPQRRYSPKRDGSPPRSDLSASKGRYSPRRDHRSPQPAPRKEILSPRQRHSPRRDHDFNSRQRSPPRQDHYTGDYKTDRERRMSSRSPYNERGNAERRSTYSPRYGDLSPSRKQTHPMDRYSPRRRSPRAYSPTRYSPPRGRKDSPPRDGYRMSRGFSPSRHSPRRLSPTRRSPPRYSPGRLSPRRRHGSPLSPRRYTGRESPRRLSPGMRRVSQGKYSPYGRRSPRGYSPRMKSPDRYRSPFRSPERLDRMPEKVYRKSPLPEMRPDSTIPDSELRAANVTQGSQMAKDISGSPKRVSLDERLEKELGLEREPLPPPPVPVKAPTLPTSIPTYDDQAPPKPVIAPEKEQAMAAAQMVTSKLLEMQAAKEAERARKREQRMAERLAAAAQQSENASMRPDVGGIEKITATGRILEHVEAQELASEEQSRKKKLREANSAGTPTLITLKPREKKQKKKKVEPVVEEEDWPEYTDTPRSPVPIPDNSVCKSVLVKFGFGVSKEAGKKKSVKYKDGVLPGRVSPVHSGDGDEEFVDLPKEKSSKQSQGKKYKKIKVMVISYKRADEPPPPCPPPGSPPRFHTSDLITKFAEARILETKT